MLIADGDPWKDQCGKSQSKAAAFEADNATRPPHATELHHGQKPKASFTGRIYARNLTMDQKALDNREESICALRPYRLQGRTPAQALREALAIDALTEIIPAEEETDQPLPAAA